MRDLLKDAEYYNLFVEEEEKRIRKFQNAINNNEVAERQIIPVKTEIHNTSLGVIIAEYSMGKDIKELKTKFIELNDDWHTVYSEGNYNKKLKMISLMVLFNVEINEEMIELLKNDKEQDWLINFLLKYLTGKSYDLECKLLFPKGISVLKEAVISDNKIDCIKKYLEKHWYNKDCGCYEAHKSKENVYYGYWSFEAGAVAKILGVDDSSLKDEQYYPYDLVHFEG